MMKTTKIFLNSILTASLVLFIAACSSGGSGSQAGINLTGNWRAETIINDTKYEMRLTLAQKASATLGLKETTLDGNLLISSGCVFSFSGAILNLDTGSLTIDPGGDFSFIGTANNSEIVGTFNSLDDDPTDNEGCGTFQSSITTFVRI
jgi:D-lyxose ketol-isomerase